MCVVYASFRFVNVLNKQDKKKLGFQCKLKIIQGINEHITYKKQI